ncbi:ABC transporter substrate-binding protein [Pseudodonghicola xiamenensis]|uniref:ABC transporter substrate-binding protein n=1 Tax=Pseudodonghicola xiamenensis TaxID=337702 RepID=A0A8J3MDL8_9RHOB|nr:ABC transporter substrate-binding protein [Pseudodonghicola xiamenensis]GHG97260.1 ABC transporter substrate-binding protein [Pseudodonghicola xiamenensis]
MKTILIASTIALSATMAGAQTIPQEVTEPVTITFYNYNLSSAGGGADATRKMIAEFEALNPLIKVEGVPVPAQDITAHVQADIVAGQPVDVAQITFPNLGYLAENFGAKALEDMIAPAELEAHFEGMVPNGLELGRIAGKAYGLAYTFSTPVLFYNADIFREAGLDPEQPPRTWSELRTAAEAVAEKTDHLPLATGIYGPTALDWLMLGSLNSAGGSVMNDDRTELTFADPQGVMAIETMRDLAQNELMGNMSIMAQMEGMASGNTAMYLQSSAVQGYLVVGAKDNFEPRTAAMPAFDGYPVKPSNSGAALMTFSTDPAKQRASWELMKYLTSKRGYTVITSEIGYLPLRPEIVNDPEYLADWAAANPLLQPNLEQLSDMTPYRPLPGPNYLQIVISMMDAMEMATFGDDDDVAGQLSSAQERLQRMMP